MKRKDVLFVYLARKHGKFEKDLFYYKVKQKQIEENLKLDCQCEPDDDATLWKNKLEKQKAEKNFYSAKGKEDIDLHYYHCGVSSSWSADHEQRNH